MQRDKEYMLDIDIGIVWETVRNDLPLLVDSLENILGAT